MNRELKKLITRKADLVRRWAEYKVLIKWPSIPHFEDLCGWCAITAAKLFVELEKEGITGYIYYTGVDGCNHVFLVVEDHVVDVTATQYTEFQHQPIVILHLKEAEVYPFYQADDLFFSANDLVKHQIKQEWEASQVPTPELLAETLQ